jgi:hypothetical protein
MSSRTVALAALLLVTMACGSDSPAGPSSGSGSGSGKGTVTANIDGVAYTGSVNAATNTNGVLNVASNSADLTRAIAFAAPAAVGTATVFLGSAVSFTAQNTNGSAVTGAWGAGGQFGSGTLTITSLTSTSASGTFSFTGVVTPGSPTGTTGTKAVTNGAFTANF